MPDEDEGLTGLATFQPKRSRLEHQLQEQSALLADLERQHKGLIKLYLRDGFEVEELEEMSGELKARIETVKNEIKSIRRQLARPYGENGPDALLEMARQDIESVQTYEEKSAIIEDIDLRVTFEPVEPLPRRKRKRWRTIVSVAGVEVGDIVGQ